MRIVVVQGPESAGSWSLQPGENGAGREPENAIHLPSRRVSRRHCVFTLQHGRVFVRDLGSANGVVIEGRRVHEAEVQQGQRLQLGDFLLTLEAAQASQATGWNQQPAAQQPPAWGQQPAAQQPAGQQPAAQPAAGGQPAAQQQQQQQEQAPQAGWGQQQAAQQPDAWGQQAAQPQQDAWGQQQGGWGQQAAGQQAAGQQPPEPQAAQPQAPEQQAQQPSPWGQQAQQGGWGQQEAPQQQGWGAQGGYDEVAHGGGPPPDYDNQGTGTVTREVDGGAGEGKAAKLVQLIKQLPFPARLGVVLWAAVIVLLLSPIGGLLPLVSSANTKIHTISVERGIAITELVGYRNVTHIVDRKNALIDTRFVEGKPGVKFAMVTDPRGVVLAPPERSGQTLEKDSAYVQAALEGGVGRAMEGELLKIMVPVKAVTREGAPISTVGYAYLLYDAKDVASMVGSLTLKASLSVLLMIAIAVALFFAVWRLTVVPVAQLREETELAVKGHQSKTVARVPWRQLQELAHSINRAIQRMEGHAPEQDPASAAASGPDPRVGAILLASGFPVLMIDEDLRISELNAAAAYLLGVAEDGAVGSNVVDLLPDRDVGSKLRRMLDAIGAGQGNVFSDTAALSGQQRRITVAGASGPSGGAPQYSVVVIT